MATNLGYPRGHSAKESYSSPWPYFSSLDHVSRRAATYVQELTTIDLQQSGPDDRDPLLILARAILDLESLRISRGLQTRLPLLSMLRRFRTKKSSDPRDKVFALLGLCKDDIQASIKPDYSLSGGEVMLRTTIALISENHGLEPLAGRVAGPEYLHSWVTNWYEQPTGSERERRDCLRLYDASGGQPGVAHLHGQAILEVQGHFIGEVKYSSDEAPDDGFERLRGSMTQWELSWANTRARSFSSGYTHVTDAFRGKFRARSFSSSYAHWEGAFGELSPPTLCIRSHLTTFHGWVKVPVIAALRVMDLQLSVPGKV